MTSITFSRVMRLVIFTAVLAMMAVVCTPAVLAQKGCAAFDMPAGPEYGNFITGFWYAEGHAFLGHEQLYLKISVWDTGGSVRGQKGNVMKGTETALYDFGKEGTFRTTISYVVEHNNDPSKFYLNAVEMIVPGSGTGRFVGATGTITDHGPFGISNSETMDGWAIFTSHGAICGASSAT